MTNTPAVFSEDIFPEILATEQFRGFTFLFFDQKGLPTSQQLERVKKEQPDWSLFTWGWWGEDADPDDLELEGITWDSDSFEDFELTSIHDVDQTSSLAVFDLVPDGSPAEGKHVYETNEVGSRRRMLPDTSWGVVAIDCPTWATVLVCEWLGCMNVSSSAHLSQVLKLWNERWGVEVLSFGGDEDDADLLVRVPEQHVNDPELFRSMGAAADDVKLHRDKEYGPIVNLWWD